MEPYVEDDTERRHSACIYVSQAGLWIYPCETTPTHHDLLPSNENLVLQEQMALSFVTACVLHIFQPHTTSVARFLPSDVVSIFIYIVDHCTWLHNCNLGTEVPQGTENVWKKQGERGTQYRHVLLNSSPAAHILLYV